MSVEFKDVTVYHRTRGGTVVSWRLKSGAVTATVFRVWYSDSGVSDWRLAGAITGATSLVDIQRRQYATDTRVAYRVEAVAGGASVMSHVTYAGIALDDKHALAANAIMRKERMLLEKRTGTPGLLWKRKHWGGKCSRCIDPDTGEPRDSHCPECFATGIAGGYYPAVDYLFALGPFRARKLTETQQGMTNQQLLGGRGLPCPRLDTGDVWATCATDERYVVGAIKETLIQGAVLLYEQVELSLAPAADVVYELPREGTPGGDPGGVLLDGGSILVWDSTLGGYYPIGVVAGEPSVVGAQVASYRLEAGRLLLLDLVTGEYRAVGLQDGDIVSYDVTADAPLADVSQGDLRLWDSITSSYREVGLVNGVFTALG